MANPGRRLTWALRTALGLIAGSVAALACRASRREIGEPTSHTTRPEEPTEASREGQLTARPHPPVRGPTPGLQRLGLGDPCDGLLYVPAGYRADRPARFILALHGASGVGLFTLWPIIRFADAYDLILLAPDARGGTWDRVRASYGPDVAFVNRALGHVFDRYAIDPTHCAIGGFSDGASYALSLGLTNGDLFSHVIAFSPGFLAPSREEGRPRIFVSHGTRDTVLPIACSERVVTFLRNSGYDVTYRVFDGPHVVPIEIAREAVRWFVG